MDLQIVKRDQLADNSLIGADHGGAGVCLIFVDSAPGEGPAQHKHTYEEVFVTLEGEATFVVDGEEIVAGPNEVVIVPPDTPHGFTNTGQGRLRQVNIHVSPEFHTDWL
jgi:mannose-6-phosphate isomerase-like protein (cupin superfamily)